MPTILRTLFAAVPCFRALEAVWPHCRALRKNSSMLTRTSTVCDRVYHVGLRHGHTGDTTALVPDMDEEQVAASETCEALDPDTDDTGTDDADDTDDTGGSASNFGLCKA